MGIADYTYEDALRDLSAQYGLGTTLYALIDGVSTLLFTPPGSWDFAGVIAYVMAIRAGKTVTVARTPWVTPPPPPPPPPTPVPAGGIEGVIQAFQSASATLYNAYQIVYAWVWPFWLLSVPLYTLSELFMSIAEGLANFQTWVSEVTTAITTALSWDSIRALILAWLPGLPALMEWFISWRDYLLAIVNNWWTGVQGTVRVWIDAATQGLQGLLAAWGEFRDYQLPNLVSWGWLSDWWQSRLSDVQGLIDSDFTIRQDLWDGWNVMREKVVELFRDPERWLLDKIESMLARFW